MKYSDAVKKYMIDLEEKKYSYHGRRIKRAALTNWFSYTLALLHTDIPLMMKEIKKPIFFNNQKLFSNTNLKRIKAVKHFLNILNNNNNVIYLNINTFLKEYEQYYLESDSLKELKKEALKNFFKAVALSLPIERLNERISNECINLLKSMNKNRVIGTITHFLIFCYEKKWTNFNPFCENKRLYSRCYEVDFIGDYDGIWKGYLKKYIDYLRFERNCADGGIDYRIRKLRVFTRYVDENNIKKPDINNIRNFLDIKAKKGVKKKTLSYYLYEIKYLFNFLKEKNVVNTNPALDLKIKYTEEGKKEVLTEDEVYKILTHFEDEIYRYKNSKDINTLQIYFRLIRDRLIIQFFIFLGLRLSELSNIKTKDIDLEKKSIEITGKGNRSVRQKITEIKIEEYLLKSIIEYLKIRDYCHQEYFFISWSGKRLSHSQIIKNIHSRIKKADITKKISPHRLRATCASLYIKKGIDPLTLKSIMRHNSITTTIDKYTQLTEDELRKVWKMTNPLKGVFDE
jgi:site-specific recombinase XerD